MVLGDEGDMNAKYSIAELTDGCRRYVRLSSLEQEKTDLFAYWDHLFFEMAVKSCCAADVWRVLRNIIDADLSEAQLAFISAGPFEEMLVSLEAPMPRLFEPVDFQKVRSLAAFLWPGRIKPEVFAWIRKL